MSELAEQPQAVDSRVWTRSLIGLGVGIIIIVVLAYYLRVNGQELITKLQSAAPEPLIFAAFGALVMLGLQSLRWWLVMRPVLNLTYAQAYRAMAVGFFFNVLLPARGGDLLRVQYLGKRTGVSRAKLLGTEIVDFWSDKWGWVAAFPVVCLFGKPPAWLFVALAGLGSMVIGVGVLLALMGSGLVRSKGPEWLRNLRNGFAVNHWKRLLLVETVIAPLPWLWECFVISVAAHAVGLDLTYMQSFAVLTGFNLAMAVPSPGNMGTFESGGTEVLVQLGVASPTAMAFIFLYHLTQVVPSMAAGALILVFEGEALFGRRSVFTQPVEESAVEMA